MDKVIFGDNQFFGVNHMSEEKARNQLMRFKDIDSIIEVLDIAYELGINTFMCTTHEKIALICDHVRNNPEKYSSFKFYPCMPYAHKYADAVTELGVFKALQSFVKGSNVFSLLAHGSMAAAKVDAVEVMKLLVDAEMKMFKGLNTPVIFLQNVIVDLLMGLGYKDIFKEFEHYVIKKYNAEPGYITMNLPMLLDVLEEVGVENPIVCCNINKIGFRMCGGVNVYEKLLSERNFRPIAMSVFASGAIEPKEAIEYTCNLKGLQSIVFGASSRKNITQSKQLIEDGFSKIT
jgi:hypothetical protein